MIRRCVAVVLLIVVWPAAAVPPPAGAPATRDGQVHQPSGPPVPQTDQLGITWVMIPAGTFEMGCVPDDDECATSELPRHPVRISRPFLLMTTEVTVGMYRRLAPPPVQPMWSTGDRQPVVDVTWGEARGFCAAAGGRLPTEAEWEYAARGGRVGDRFVWGSATMPHLGGRPASNMADISGRRAYPYLTIVDGYNDGYVYAAPVGSFPPNAYGLFDMAGNVWEWVADRYDAGYYARSPVVDPKGPPSGRLRVVRGSCWYGDPVSLRVSRRGGDEPVRRPIGDGGGFRCARDLVR
ncbi:MAG TPA: SUMF1/EgtB/PvdO family nonheme iron enzyme [Thermoanaerobaculaceae bacterium]|nr:SUMF1/EgtB/PvdO family nonheme iron enzyme [Thermoanaerobaculaceae bacterium]